MIRAASWRASAMRAVPPIWAATWSPAQPPVPRPNGMICAATRMADTVDHRPDLFVMEVIVRL
jgi:hypothetical protein